MKIFFIIFYFLTVGYYSYSQQNDRKNALYLEAGGSGLFGSINYQRQLSNHYGPALRVGIGFYSENDFYLTFPVAIDYLFPLKNKASFIDCSLGATWTDKDSKLFGNQNDQFVSFVPVIGYRHHYKKNVLARINFTPIINNTGFYPWVGLSIGKQF